MGGNKHPMPLETADKLASRVYQVLTMENVRAHVCGSIRRRRPIVNDIDIVVSVSTMTIYKILKSKFELSATLTKKGDKYGNFLIEGVQFDFHYSPTESWGAALLFLTGSGLFNIMLRGIAKKQGYLLNERGLWFGEDLIAGLTEEQIFDALGYVWLKPQDREVTVSNRRRRWLREKR